MVAHYKEMMDLDTPEETRIRDVSFLKIKGAPSYADFFKRNVSSEIKNKRILEFGSGQGIVAMEFSLQEAEVTGIDIDTPLLKITRDFAMQKGLKAEFVSYDHQKIPFTDNYFDYCYSIQIFEHLDDPVDSLRELYRVLKEGGILHITFPNRLYPYDAHTRLLMIPWLPYKAADIITKLRRKHGLEYYRSLHFYSYRQFLKILDKSGTNFSIVNKINTESFIKKNLIKLMHKCNLYHTISSSNISVFLKKGKY